MRNIALIFLMAGLGLSQLSAQVYQRIYRLPIKQEIGMPVRKIVLDGLEEAKKWDADLILVEMDTYGGAVDAADDIRTALLNSPIPVWVYIENNAASAGAFISIACEKIFMKPGATIGAATVVDSQGEKSDEKYQSFMRAKMRETAMQRGRDPNIAEAMVDGSIVVPGVNESGKVVSLTSSEALNLGFSDGTYSSLQELLKDKGLEKSEQKAFETGGVRSLVLFFLRPEVSGILIAVIFLGLFFELQSPGVGFPGLAALIAAVLFFIPNYLEGMAMYWEILLFLAGLLLLGLEIFVFPGFGIAGISGIILVFLSLVLSITANLPAEPGWGISAPEPNGFVRSLWVVVVAVLGSLGLVLLALKTVPEKNFFKKVAVVTELKSADGFRNAQPVDSELNGKTGFAIGPLRPGGMVQIDGKDWEARSISGWIERGDPVQVVQHENNILLVKPTPSVKADM